MPKRKPLTVDDVLTDDQFRILAAPCWAYAKPQSDGIRKPLAQLWKPLLAKLRRMAAQQFRTRMVDYNRRIAAGEPTQIGAWKLEPPPKVKIKPPYFDEWDRVLSCAECGADFYSKRKRHCPYPKCCSNACAVAVRRRWSKTASLKRSAERAAERKGRTCDYCGEPLNAQRSTNKFCSAKCRVYAARKRKQSTSKPQTKRR
jgi:hypothetical protein